jgi:hypothetical protein
MSSRRPTRFLPFTLVSVLALGVACGTGPLDHDGDDSGPGTGDERIVFFSEGFEDGAFANRGWYDNLSPVTTTAEASEGERSLEVRFMPGATTAVWGGAMRHEFPATETVHVRYDVKFADGWVGSERLYHPHELYLLTNLDDRFTGPSTTYLTAYIETNVREGEILPRVGLGDRLNIDTSNIGVDLTGVTEARAVAGCNGEADGYPTGCYEAGGGAWGNEKTWMLEDAPIERGGWHRVEVLLQMNTVRDGVGVADGVVRYWLDGALVLDLDDVLIRTGANAGMAFEQLLVAPYIGDGSPVEQVFWVDALEVADRR